MHNYEIVSLWLFVGVILILIVCLFLIKFRNESIEKEYKSNLNEVELLSYSYHIGQDMLYGSVSGESLDYCCRLEDTSCGIIVHYNDKDDIIGIEIYEFSRFANNNNVFPLFIDIDSSTPFRLKIPNIIADQLSIK